MWQINFIQIKKGAKIKSSFSECLVLGFHRFQFHFVLALQLFQHLRHAFDLLLLLAQLAIFLTLVDAVRHGSAVVEVAVVAVQSVGQSGRSVVLVEQLVGHLPQVLHVADDHRSQMQEIGMIGIHYIECAPAVVATEGGLTVNLAFGEERND